MPYAVLEKKIAMVPPQFLRELSAFVDFLLYKQDNAGDFADAEAPTRLRTPRKLGGFEKGFYIAPDFDEPLEEFKEYM